MERKMRVVLEVTHETKQHLPDARNSAGPATSESLDKVQTFLTGLEKEVASDLPKENWIRRSVRLTVTLALLLALNKLLNALVPEAIIKVIVQFLGR